MDSVTVRMGARWAHAQPCCVPKLTDPPCPRAIAAQAHRPLLGVNTQLPATRLVKIVDVDPHSSISDLDVHKQFCDLSATTISPPSRQHVYYFSAVGIPNYFLSVALLLYILERAKGVPSSPSFIDRSLLLGSPTTLATALHTELVDDKG